MTCPRSHSWELAGLGQNSSALISSDPPGLALPMLPPAALQERMSGSGSLVEVPEAGCSAWWLGRKTPIRLIIVTDINSSAEVGAAHVPSTFIYM